MDTEMVSRDKVVGWTGAVLETASFEGIRQCYLLAMSRTGPRAAERELSFLGFILSYPSPLPEVLRSSLHGIVIS